MKLLSKIFIFNASKQQYKTSPELMYVGCAVLKEIESPDGMKVCVNSGGVTTRILFILSGLFVALFWTKHTSYILHRLVRVELSTCNKWLCYKLLTTTETTTELMLFPLSLKGGKGDSFISSLIQTSLSPAGLDDY